MARLDVELLEVRLGGGDQVHFMRINNLGFLFQIEGLSSHLFRVEPLIFAEVFLVTRADVLGVGVPYKLICAPGPPSLGLAGQRVGKQLKHISVDEIITSLILTLAHPHHSRLVSLSVCVKSDHLPPQDIVGGLSSLELCNVELALDLLVISASTVTKLTYAELF